MLLGKFHNARAKSTKKRVRGNSNPKKILIFYLNIVLLNFIVKGFPINI